MILEERVYYEKELVEMLCSPKQIQAYKRDGRFNSTNSRKSFWKKLSALCDYERIPRQKIYFVCNVFDKTNSDAAETGRVNAEIQSITDDDSLTGVFYMHVLPLLTCEIYKQKDESVIWTTMDLAEAIGMINQNYRLDRKNIKLLHKRLGVPNDAAFEFYSASREAIYGCIQRYLDKLCGLNYFVRENIYFVQSADNEKRPATETEIELYFKTAEKILKAKNESCHISAEQIRPYIMNKWFRTELIESGVPVLYTGFTFRDFDSVKCEEEMKRASIIPLEGRKMILSYALKKKLDRNAESRALKRGLDDRYVECFKLLSAWTVLRDAEIVKK